MTCLDFGTTFSGSCYAITSRLSPKEPKQDNLYHKTPSIIVCDRNFHLLHWGMTALDFIQSGHVKDDHRVFEKFKLQLPSSIAQEGAFRRTGNTSQLELLCLRATIDYFRELFDHTARAMQNANIVNGLKIDKEDIRFVITVPTQWNDVQKSLMRLIAIEAGLISKYDNGNRLKIISESSAALLYCERRPNMKKLKIEDTEYVIMSEGEKYMICDAGGGTVSIAVFEMLKQVDQDVKAGFHRCQITSGIRKNCGSVYLDLKMKEVLLDICFGADKESWKNNKSKREELETLLTPLTDQFLLKLMRGLDGDIITDEGVTVEHDENHFEIRLSYKFMREKVFDEVVDNTIDFLKRQIKKANGNIKYTYLVGGFGGSPYLRKRILNEFPFGHPLHIGSLIQDDRGDTAAMRGAAYYGNYPEIFTERVSRRSYAIQVYGYKRQKFEIDIEKSLSKMKLRGGKNVKNDIYNEEAANAYSDVNKPVNLYYQSSYNSSLKDSDSLRTPDDVTFLISRGDKISAHNQMHGILKRFYAEEECIVYACKSISHIVLCYILLLTLVSD
ncbi:uncharacterized protein EV154DRAFT_420603 [Mucor mucedo]|uniref:uncharacterized protein n=1 Tax=Mucor mucedo TaxID=29922 RepID=UPI00221FF0D9|nr:uncharacterized protein EV154DRAFT_420603 [Mucor mucedo]KAI7891318.1 hypothetical protein EV154DRAFT_420603 [Mucor mucedo]